jgi:hypothetical protein
MPRSRKSLAKDDFILADRHTQIIALYDEGTYIGSTIEGDVTIELYSYNGFRVKVQFKGRPRALVAITVM